MEREYKGYRLKGSTLRGKPEVGIIFKKSLDHIVDGRSLDEAFEKAKAWIDARNAKESDERKGRPPEVATKEQYIRFFRGYPLKDYELAMLRANASGPMSAERLAKAAGWDSYETANRWYGGLGREVGTTLGLTFRKYDDGSDFYMSALVKEVGERDPETGHFLIHMHPELVEALRDLGYV